MGRIIMVPRRGLLIPQPASFVFNGTDENIQRVLSTSSPNTTIFTYSLWVKSAAAGDVELINVGASGVTDNSDHVYFYLEDIGTSDLVNVLQETGNVIDWIEEPVGGSLTTGVWRHFVFRYDSTQGTAANRIRIYVNGTVLSDAANPAPSASEAHRLFTNGRTHGIGRTGFGRMNGKLAFIDVLEGVSADPTAFAFDDGGTWTRMPYAGSYGTYGFSLDGTDGFNDVSGNGQNFTGVNMDASNLDVADLPPYTI